MQLSPVVRTATGKTVEEYEAILGIGNPLHLDDAYARRTPFKGVIAHGTMMLAHVPQMMAAAFAKGLCSGGELDTTFVRPVRPGDTITTWGTITGQQRDERGVGVFCELHCENQKGQTVLEGTAPARMARVIAGVPELPD